MGTPGSKNRKALKRKMVEVFGDKIEAMPCELQNILLDDLVTAFENRLDVLSQAQSILGLRSALWVECFS